MPAVSIPTQPDFITASEQEVWTRLCRQLDGSTILANFRLSDRDKDHEIDLVALMPGSGIVTIEVKGSHVWHDEQNWRISRGSSSEVIHPVAQARDACYSLRHYVESDPRWGSRGKVRWSHHVVLARTELAADFSLPECPRWQVSGSSDLATLGDRVWDTTSLHRTDARLPSQDDIDLVLEILSGRGLPGHDPAAQAEDRRRLADQLTMEQANLLTVLRLVNRIEVRGGAGSGKTVLAQRQATELASGVRTGAPQRVAVVCYSYGLAEHLRRALLLGSRKKQPAFVGSFAQLARQWGVEVDTARRDSQFWEVELPVLMSAAAEGLEDGQKFDSIIIDEAQDFAEDWWQVVLAALRDPESGGVYAFADERQRVFERFGRPPIPLVPLVLDHNLRNTRQIGESFIPLAPTSMKLRGQDGPKVSFVQAGGDEALEAADAQVDGLLDEGWALKDIVLLTTGRRHPVQEERQGSMGFDGYWADFWSDEDVFYSHVLGFKGLERRAVVLCVNEDGTRERGRERLYVGLSRATDRLVVVGDLATIEKMGGAEVAQRLAAGAQG